MNAPPPSADALLELCAGETDCRAAAAGVQLVVHVPATSLPAVGTVRPHGPATTTTGDIVDTNTLSRLLCDPTVRTVATGADGSTVDGGRIHRIPGPALRRAIAIRDEHCCTFPGCSRRVNLHAHHIRPWHLGGKTTAANLAMLCHRHHRAVHDAHWKLRREPTGRLRWTSPTGNTAPPPPMTDPDRPWPEVIGRQQRPKRQRKQGVSRPDFPDEPPF